MYSNHDLGRVPKIGVADISAVARADGAIDINAALRSLLEGLLNAVMDEQASELGVPRNGYRERSLDTCVGRVTLRIPKLREGTYFPEGVVTRWSRTGTAPASAVCDMRPPTWGWSR